MCWGGGAINQNMSDLHLPTPSLEHFSNEDYDKVYEPAQDTFLFLDALQGELQLIKAMQPSLCLEIGSSPPPPNSFVAHLFLLLLIFKKVRQWMCDLLPGSNPGTHRAVFGH